MARTREREFTLETRQRVKQEQAHRCGYCGENKKPLEVHHIQPIFLGGGSERNNAVALDSECHKIFNTMVFEDGITYTEYMMEDGVEYYVGVPKRRVDSQQKGKHSDIFKARAS